MSASIVLVGLCNDDPLLQTYLGTFHIDFTTKKPVLSQWLYNGHENCFVEFYNDTYIFKSWLGGHGLEIRKRDNVWTFFSGLHSYSSGSSGLLINGGPELEKLLKDYNETL